MSVETDTDLELYGISPRVIEIYMIIITILPLGVIKFGENVWIIYSVLWTFPMLTLVLLWLIIPLYIFNILYIRQIARFFYGKSSRDSATMCGILSIIFPTLAGIVLSILLGLPYSSYLYIYPIPIQFFVGLVFLSRIRGPENISAWSGQFIDWSWWKQFGVKRANWASAIIEIYFEEEETVMSMNSSESDQYYNEVNREGDIVCRTCSKKIKPVYLCEVCGRCIDCCQCDFDD